MSYKLDDKTKKQSFTSFKDFSSEILQRQNDIREGKIKIKKIESFQIWALQFVEKYDCKKSLPILMRYGKIYKNNLEYLKYIDGWISDYPNRKGDAVKLFLWKIKYDKTRR